MIGLKLQYVLRARKQILLLMAAVLTSSCGGGGGGTAQGGITTTAKTYGAGTASGTLTMPPATTGWSATAINTVPITVDAGPVPTLSSAVNVAYVSVTVCAPGTTPATAACQTIDHVTVDTGSYGLRLLKSALYASLNLPQVKSSTGSAIGECVPFAIGTTWGSVRSADIYLGGEVARDVPIQDIGDTPGGAGIPNSCSAYGTIQDTQATLGSNGILGVGPFQNDCDACLNSAIPGAYYTCTTSGCTSSTVTAAQVVQNPVARFDQNPASPVKDNNGVLIELLAVLPSGANNSLHGSLIFGIGTETNNQVPVSATVYATDQNGNFITTYNGTSMPYSFIDSGSNALFFNDATIPTCSTNSLAPWAYCPSSSLTLSAINTAASGSSTGTVSFSIVNADQLFLNNSVVAGNIGGPSTFGSFDWGLPFFFGRSVFTAISGASTPAGNGPYFAY